MYEETPRGNSGKGSGDAKVEFSIGSISSKIVCSTLLNLQFELETF